MLAQILLNDSKVIFSSVNIKNTFICLGFQLLCIKYDHINSLLP